MNRLHHLLHRSPLAVGLAILALAAALIVGYRSAGSDRSEPLASRTAAAGTVGDRPERGGSDAGSVRSVAEGQAGTVGDLTVTEEAMQLAEIRVEPVKRQVVPEKLAVSGAIEAGGDRTAKVTPRVGGKVTRVLVVAGDTVRAGQTLALIESSELAQAQAAYRQATARVGVARSNLDRQRKLASLGAFGRPNVEEARMQSAAAEGEVSAARSEVAAARHEVTEARSEKAALEGDVASAQSEVASAKSEVVEAEGHVRASQAALVQAQAQAKTMKARLERADLLLKEELISRQEWEQTQTDHERAQADIEAARAGIAQSKARVESARARVRAAEAKVRAASGRVQQAGARIESTLAKQTQAEARLSAASKRGEIGAQALAREEDVYKGGYAASREVVEAEAALQQAQLEVQAAEQAVHLLGGRPGGGSTVAVTAPIGGRVQERNVTLGETVDTEHPLFTVIDLARVWAQLAVTPRDLPRVRLGQQVELSADSAPGRTFAGSVSAIGSVADETTRAVPVRVSLVNPGGQDEHAGAGRTPPSAPPRGGGQGGASPLLRPGLFVRGSLITDVRREQIVVPKGALQEHTGRKTLYVALGRPGVFEVRHVALGESGEDWYEIRDGLKGTERVAVSGTFYLKSEALKSQLSDGCCAVETGKE